MQVAQGPSIKVHFVALPLIRWGLEQLLRDSHPQFEIVSTSSFVRESLPLLERYAADVVVLDLDGVEGPEDLAELQANPRAKLIVLTASTAHRYSKDQRNRIVIFAYRNVLQRNSLICIYNSLFCWESSRQNFSPIILDVLHRSFDHAFLIFKLKK